jgi:hypothetical protein
MGKDRDVDAVLRKCAGVLGQAELCEPIGNFLHRRPRPTEFGLVDPLDERFYPIDRAARNRPKQSAGRGRAGPRQGEPQAGAGLQPPRRTGRLRTQPKPLRGARSSRSGLGNGFRALFS